LSADQNNLDKSSIENINLVNAWELALQEDTQWLSDQASFASRGEIKAQARAALLPRLSTTAAVAQVETETQASGVNPGTTDPNGAGSGAGGNFFNNDFDGTSSSYAVSLSQPLLNVPAYHGYKGANLELDVIELNRQQALQQLMLRVSQAYFNLLMAEESKTLAFAEKKAINRQLEQTRQRFKVGLLAKTDVLEAQAALDQANVVLAVADNEIAIAHENLSIIIGQPFNEIAKLEDQKDLKWSYADNYSAWLESVKARNLNMKVVNLNVQQAETEYKSVKSSYLPTVNAVASYSNSDSFTESNTQSIGLEAQWVPFQGGGLRSKIRQAALNLEKARTDLSGLQKRLHRDAANLIKTLKTDKVRIQAQGQAIASAQSALDATQAGYDVGTRNIVDVLQAQRLLFRARSDYANARYAYVLNGLKAAELEGDLGIDELKTVVSWSKF